MQNNTTATKLNDSKFVDSLQEKIVNDIIAQESDKVTNFFNGSFLENTEIEVSKTSGLVSVVLKFNYCGDKYNYFCLPYSSFIIQGMTIVYKDQNVFCWESDNKSIKTLEDKAKVFFNSMLTKLNS